ncbi:CHC2 zinc finger domain-containing protein [Acinetobacter gerneri]|uniref:DNA primase n=1 Tax=Acinetobacter gerneri TaxID=202952 RepID=A0AAW8JF39_9GAMM|nr:CHC2 zinc finger domain-containing protein [Acinetobacter gerneri]MDQ9008715.1 CHC2 zinc finger domain-containing protein [Acinetobacter gerneri]MDQ9012737.1 CHC2 zinc finger domain-containing protein [Acinetobacter gerneri]MDQ9024254.1 CHC2 zinc finger domain-containing protein [Acinetobacter gerneri]MDQ9051491.1 CHC2 zinc finger domain-containing protein [Acinetobacter gerneri]MDQ9058714.1 CHC2 zinc finger domain-containing protein [Acinetobacter gerneri]
MAIPQHTIDQILDRTDIVDLIGQRVKLKKTGRTYSGCCPFHQEKSPSFHVYRDKQYYHCFGCQANGNAIRFLMDIDSRNFVDVMKDLSSQTGIELPKDNHDNKRLAYKRESAKPAVATPKVETKAQENAPVQADINNFEADPFEAFQYQEFDPSQFDLAENAEPSFSQEGNLYDLLENVAQFYERQLPNSKSAQKYFKHRGLSQDTLQFWRLGYAPEDWQHLEKAFPQDIEGLKLLGLIRSSDSGRDFDLLRDRVIFPIRDAKGRVVGFGGRALNDEIKPKYINSPDSEVFHKNQLLYGLYEGRKQRAQDWLMVEGYMDVIALQQYGIHGAVATLGTASNTEHLNILFKQNSRITIAFDGDAAGQKAAKRTLEIALPLLNDGRELKFFVLPKEHDPDSLIRREGIETFKKLWDQAPLLSDFVFALLSQQFDVTSPEGKSQVMAELNQLTELLPKQGSYRYLLRQFFREKLGFNKKWQAQVSLDASLSFNIRTKDEDFAVAILMNHPFLYIHFENLRAVIPQEELLAQVLNTFDKVFDELPDDQELATYYMLGACSRFHQELSDIMQRTNIQALTQAPEMADKLASEYALALQEKYLKQKLKAPLSLIESRNLRQQLNELTKKIGLRLLHS